jgi:hypothetical protein
MVRGRRHCEGYILSLSNWRDEKSLVRWRTRQSHNLVQQKGRDDILESYHLRVGEIFADNQIPAGMKLPNQDMMRRKSAKGRWSRSSPRPAPAYHPNDVTAFSQLLGLVNGDLSDRLA